MTEQKQTTLERLFTTIAATVVAAALVGVFILLQELQKSQAELSSDIAVMASQLQRTSESVADQRERIRRLESQLRWRNEDGSGQ